jgi:hypothetical protein
MGGYVAAVLVADSRVLFGIKEDIEASYADLDFAHYNEE